MTNSFIFYKYMDKKEIKIKMKIISIIGDNEQLQKINDDYGMYLYVHY